MLTGLGEAGADPFTLMKTAGQSRVKVSQRYVHPTPEGMERAFERLQNRNDEKGKVAEVESQAEGASGFEVPRISPRPQKHRRVSYLQVTKTKLRALSSAVRAADS